jgi:protein TonB
MRTAPFSTSSYRTSAYQAQGDARSRATSVALALGIAALILLALLRMGGIVRPDFGDGRPLSTFDVSSEGKQAERTTRKAAAKAKQQAAAARTSPVTPRPVDVPQPPVPLSSLHLPGVMILNQSDYAATDIGKIKGTAGPALASNGGDAGDGDEPETVGRGPGGAPLYAAEWYREPTRAEMSTYLPHDGRTGWGMVACRTAERFRVEDCRELGETPGSGIARALRQASFQFLVRPPRRGGQPMIGVWVRIKFDLVRAPAE